MNILSTYVPSSTAIARAMFNGPVHGFRKCRLCNAKYKFDPKTTTSMDTHCKNKHYALYKQLSDLRDSKAVAKAGKKQPTIMEGLMRYSKDAFHGLVLSFVIATDQSFRVVEDQAFINMLRGLKPDVDIPTRRQVKRLLMIRFDKEARKMVQFFGSVTSKISFTTDVWTSQNNNAFNGITWHYCDENFELQSGLLAFMPFDGSHTGENIAGKFKEALDTFRIRFSQVMAITVDNASNNDTFISSLVRTGVLSNKEAHIRCFAHVLNLAAQDALKEIGPIFYLSCKLGRELNLCVDLRSRGTASDSLARCMMMSLI
jgi:hypothetical protein